MLFEYRTICAVALLVGVTAPHSAIAGEAPRCVTATEAIGQPLASELEVLSWNIQKAGDPAWRQDFTRLANNVQLAFIQEASLQAGIPDLLPEALVEVFAPGYTTATLDSGVMTLGAAPPGLHCSFTVMEPWLGTPKAVSVAEYALAEREDTLLAINLHAVNFTFGVESFEQQIAALAQFLADHEGPAIVAGDMNTWSESRQAVLDTHMSRYGLQPVIFEPDLRTAPFGRPLDHIFVRGLSARHAEVIPVDSSDHNPLRVTLALD